MAIENGIRVKAGLEGDAVPRPNCPRFFDAMFADRILTLTQIPQWARYPDDDISKKYIDKTFYLMLN